MFFLAFEGFFVDLHSVVNSFVPLRTLFFFLFFFKSFWRTHVLFWGHWYPCFGFLVTSPLGFKARVGCLIRIAEANVMYVPEIHLWCYTCQPLGGRHAAGPVPTYCCRGEVAGIRTRALRISVSQMLSELCFCFLLFL